MADQLFSGGEKLAVQNRVEFCFQHIRDILPSIFPGLKQRLHQTDESGKLQGADASVPRAIGVRNFYQFQTDSQLIGFPGANMLVIVNGPCVIYAT